MFNKKWLLGKLAVLCVIGLWYFWKGFCRECTELASLFETRVTHHSFVVGGAGYLSHIQLLDPEQAPAVDRQSVMRGYRIVMDTQTYAKQYAGNRLNCRNCHFEGGDTLGGKGNGISLVGVTTQYPAYSTRFGKTMTLADRINNCFQRSMNGTPLPVDSLTMRDIIAYLSWISTEVAQLKTIPWRGLTALTSHHTPDPKAGEKVYQIYCAMCHQPDGSGKIIGTIEDHPPLWGSGSFNDGAGMSMMPTLSSFIYWNMPYTDPGITEDQALDVAAYILSKPRPTDIGK